MEQNGLLTIFTPTYNRAYILEKLYVSLCKQTVSAFEWLIVDDGSTDNTESLVSEWMNENKIVIRYIKQGNGGKQRAHNTGVENARGELFVCVDSDDYVTDNFAEAHLMKLSKIRGDTTIAGIVSLQAHSDGNPIGTYFPEGLKKTTLLDLYGKHKFKGDATLAYYTSVLKQYPFKVADGEKFIGETYVYSQIDQKYELSILPEILLIKEYLPDGYTTNVRKLTKKNPKSYMMLKRQAIVFSTTLKEKYENTILYGVGCHIAHVNMITDAPDKVAAILMYLPSWLAWVIFYKNA